MYVCVCVQHLGRTGLRWAREKGKPNIDEADVVVEKRETSERGMDGGAQVLEIDDRSSGTPCGLRGESRQRIAA